MSRNNEDRLGAPSQPGDFPPAAASAPEPKADQPFSFVTPTEFVDLPSRGQYYSEGHPLNGQDSVEIRYMTAKDEDILTSQSLLKKGLALDRLLQSVIVDKAVKPNDLLVGDKNAILVAVRASGYGSDYNTKVTCPVCYTSSDNVYDLSNLNVNYVDDLDDLEATAGPNKTFAVTLPRTQVEVGLRLMTGADEKKMANLAERKKKNNLPESSLTDQFRMIIVSVNGSQNQSHINELINNMPAMDSRYLRHIYTKLTPNIDLKKLFECPQCGSEEEVMIPFTTEFFWPK